MPARSLPMIFSATSGAVFACATSNAKAQVTRLAALGDTVPRRSSSPSR
jgi:hypothetical protein